MAKIFYSSQLERALHYRQGKVGRSKSFQAEQHAETAASREIRCGRTHGSTDRALL